MTTARPQPPAAVPTDDRFAVRNATWALYDHLTDALGEGAGIRLAFDGKDIEISTLGPFHERVKEQIGLFMNLVLLELAIDYEGLGSTTWKRPELSLGLEADLLLFVWMRTNLKPMPKTVFQRKSNHVADYPNSRSGYRNRHFAIEDRPARHLCRGAKVPEIWRSEK